MNEIVIPEGCEEIGDYCFEDCMLLKDIYLPSSIKKIGINAFNTGNPDTLIHIYNKNGGDQEIIKASQYVYQKPKKNITIQNQTNTKINNQNGLIQKTSKTSQHVYQGSQNDPAIPNQVASKSSQSNNKSKINSRFYILMFAIPIVLGLGFYVFITSKSNNDFRNTNIVEAQNQYGSVLDYLETENVFISDDAENIYLENEIILSYPHPTGLSQIEQENIDRLYDILTDEQSLLDSVSKNNYVKSKKYYTYLAEKNSILLDLALNNSINLTESLTEEHIRVYFICKSFQIKANGTRYPDNHNIKIVFEIKNDTGFDIGEIGCDLNYGNQTETFIGYNIKNNDVISVEAVFSDDEEEILNFSYYISYVDLQ